MQLTDEQLKSYVQILRQGGERVLLRHLTDVCEYSKDEALIIIEQCYEPV